MASEEKKSNNLSGIWSKYRYGFEAMATELSLEITKAEPTPRPERNSKRVPKAGDRANKTIRNITWKRARASLDVDYLRFGWIYTI